jgi:hypothetical protein
MQPIGNDWCECPVCRLHQKDVDAVLDETETQKYKLTYGLLEPYTDDELWELEDSPLLSK